MAPEDDLAREDSPTSSATAPADAAPSPTAPDRGEIRTAIYVYRRTTVAIEHGGPICLSAFLGSVPHAHLDAETSRTHTMTLEPGVYLVRAGAGVEVTGDDIDVMAIDGGKPARRTPRRVFRELPAIERRTLARFLRRPAPEPRPQREIRRVLAVDEDELATSRYVRGFGPARTVVTTGDPAVARALAQSAPWDLAIVELRVGSESGIELGRELKRARPGLAVALCSGYLSIELAVAAVRAGLDLVLFKPVTAQELLRRIDAADTPEPDTETLEHAEQEHIARVLSDCRGNISRAAHRLGIHRSSLQRRLRRSGAASVDLR